MYTIGSFLREEELTGCTICPGMACRSAEIFC